MKKTFINWKNVFNAHLIFWGHISKAGKAAKDAGYKYMSWNGYIYDLEKDEFTSITIKELDQEQNVEYFT